MANAADFHGSLERTQTLTRQIEEEMSNLADAAQTAVADARVSAAREAVASFNSVAQRLRRAEDESDWARTLVEAANPHCRKALWIDARADPAPAVRSAVETGETTVCAVAESEIGSAASALGEYSRVWLIPVGSRGQAKVGVLCAAADDEPDLAALELLGALASTFILKTADEPVAPEPVPRPELVQIAGASSARPASAPPAASWEDLPPADRHSHLRAQQFARVFAADLLLRGPARPVYATLKKEIDAGRDNFRREFFATCPTMVDYLHLELVRSLAGGDAAALGAGYPGPLR